MKFSEGYSHEVQSTVADAREVVGISSYPGDMHISGVEGGGFEIRISISQRFADALRIEGVNNLSVVVNYRNLREVLDIMSEGTGHKHSQIAQMAADYLVLKHSADCYCEDPRAETRTAFLAVVKAAKSVRYGS